MQYPLSPDEHTAMARYLSTMRSQLQGVSELFSTRYGLESRLAEAAVNTVHTITLLERELMLIDDQVKSAPEPTFQAVGNGRY